MKFLIMLGIGFSALTCVIGIFIALMFLVFWLVESDDPLASLVRWGLLGLGAIGASLITGNMIMHLR